MDSPRQQHDEQGTLWNGRGGQAWVEAQGLLDALFRPLEDLLLEAIPPGSGGRTLDVGCGTGGTTLAIARRLGPAGRCVGLDISEPMIAAARARAARPQLDGVQVSFVRADAQTHAFEPATFDRIVSRFGVMFFDGFVAAFTNLRRAARGGAELRFIAWRGAEENPFMTTAERAAAPLLPNLPAREPDAPGQFAFADRERVRRILEASGWTGIEIRPVDFACSLPEAELVPYFTRLGPVGRALQQEDEATRARVAAAVRPAFEPFVEGDQVRFTAACWLAGARAAAATSEQETPFA